MTQQDIIDGFIQRIRQDENLRIQLMNTLIDEKLIELPKKFSEHEREHDRSLNSIKGTLMEDTARKKAYRIIDNLGLHDFEIIESQRIIQLSHNATNRGLTRDITHGDMESFKDIDILIEAKDKDENRIYVVVEVSYTADQRDTNRAPRNARYLTRFTGQKAIPVIASVRLDNKVRHLVVGKTAILPTDPNTPESCAVPDHSLLPEGKIFWQQMPEPR